MSTDIDALVDRLSRLQGAKIGRGPRHPRSPDPSIGGPITGFLQSYPLLRQDTGYLEFLEKYSGASIEHPDENQLVDILGFTDASTDILEMDGPVVDENGFLVFAQCIHHIIVDGKLQDLHEYDFAFDVSGDHGPGVYRSHSTLRMPGPKFTHYTDNFSAWLGDLVTNNGWCNGPTSE